MQKSKNAESFIGIVIGVSILSFIIIGILNILSFNKENEGDYHDLGYIHLMESNTQNIANKLDLSAIKANEEFYIYKDRLNKEFKTFTGITNEGYKYIDKDCNKTNPDENIGKTFSRVLIKNQDILKHTINPENISNLVLHYDATNADGLKNTSLSNMDNISNLIDLSGNGLNAYQTNIDKQTKINMNFLDNKSYLSFDGIDDILKINDDSLINDNSDGYFNISYPEKSIVIVLKTGFDITSEQTIYEQGDTETGYNIMISGGKLYLGAYNYRNSGDYSASDTNYYYDWDNGHEIKTLSISKILPNTNYTLTIVQDSSHINETGDSGIDDGNNKLKLYLNGNFISEITHVDPQSEHSSIGLGGVINDSKSLYTPYPNINCLECNFFEGYIGEFIIWNNSLSEQEITGINNYLKEKWLRGKSNIYYNTVSSEIKKVN